MRKPKRRWVLAGFAVLLAGVAVPLGIRYSLTYEPDYYRRVERLPNDRQKAGAQQFVAQSLQLRNDIINETSWEAMFSDDQVNAWLAEELMAHFAELMPPGVSDPRVFFEPSRVILAFRLDDGRFRSVISVVARVRVPEPNMVALTIEKIRAGVMPVPADQVLETIVEHARARGVDVTWDRDEEFPVAQIRYQPHLNRRDIVLEHFQIFDGHVRLSGRSNRRAATAEFRLPGARVLQATFPRMRKIQRTSSEPVSLLDISRSPAS